MVLLVCPSAVSGVPPGGDVLGADGGELLPGTGLDAGMGEELVEVAFDTPGGYGGRGCGAATP